MLNIELEELPTYQLGLKQGEARGKLEGKLEEKQEMARKLLQMGAFSDQQLADITGL